MSAQIMLQAQKTTLICIDFVEYRLFVGLVYYVPVPVNSYGHVGMLPPFYETSTQHCDVMTRNVFNTITMHINNWMV